jgi:hypothetical protein
LTLDEYVAEDNPVRAVDAFVEGLDLGKLGFGRVTPLEKGRPSYHPATLARLGRQGLSMGGNTAVEWLDLRILWFLYGLGTILGTLALI